MRRLFRAPGFALVVILTIGLVVGVDATIFTALNAVLLRELPVPEPERLVRVAAITPRGETREDLPYGDFVALRDASTQVSLAAFSRTQVTAVDPVTRRVESIGAERVSDDFFDVLGAPLARGTRGVVVSRELELRMFAGDAPGRAIQIHGRTETITGVAKEPFRGTNLAAPADLWLPLERVIPSAVEGPPNVRIIGRLRPGATVWTAAASLPLSKAAARPPHSRWRIGSERAMLIQPGAPRAVAIALAIAIALMTLAALVAAANVIGVLFARIAMRRRDLAIRVALGATPRTLMREILLETMPLAIPAALLAYAIAAIGSRFFFAGLPLQTRPPIDLAPDARVALFTLALSAAAVFCAALAGALYARRTTPKGLAARGGSQRTPALLRWIVAAQLALSIVVLIVAGLLVQTARAYHSVDPGFEYARQLRAAVENVPLPRLRELAARLRAIDGTTHVAIARNTPLSRQSHQTFRGVDGEPIDALATYVDGDFFALLGIPVQGSTRGVVINEAMRARRPDLTVTGIARDARFSALADEPEPFVFLPIEQAPPLANAFLLIRTTRDPAAAARDVNAVLTTFGIPPAAHRLEDSVNADRWLSGIASIIAGALAALTLLLAAIGLFGVISASVTHRSRELAIRAAHGATRASLARLIAASGARLLVSGVLAGAVLAIPAASALASLLFGVHAFDAPTWIAVAIVVTCTVAAAIALPARRAMAVTPSELLRES